jgi:Flp pilus assembly protein TadG
MYMDKENREKGQNLLEFALILPVLLVILSGLLDLGRLYFSYVAVTDAAGEGATYAALCPDDTAGIVARAQDASGGLVEIDPNMVEVYYPEDLNQAVAVGVSYEFSMATPLVNAMLPDGALMLRADAVELILTGDL